MVLMPEDWGNETWTTIEIFVSSISLLFFIISLFLLFRFNAWGRILFTANLILSISITFSIPEHIISTGNFSGLLDWFGGALDGAMLAMMYLTSLKERFEKVKE
jgi:hypothetical protein